MVRERKIALLIDAENISHQFIGQVMASVMETMDGLITVKRIYADWTKPNLSAWKAVLRKYALMPIQQYSFSDTSYSVSSVAASLVVSSTASSDSFSFLDGEGKIVAEGIEDSKEDSMKVSEFSSSSLKPETLSRDTGQYPSNRSVTASRRYCPL